MGVAVKRFEMAGPDDAQGIVEALQALGPARIDRLALAVKVEGTATINDFSRALALRAIEEAISAAGLSHAQRQIIVSTGCEGVCSPGGYLIADVRDSSSEFPALAFGVGQSAELDARDMIGVEHVTAAALATKRAMDQAGLTPSQVALVLLKSPVLTRAAASAAGPAARPARANSTALSRAAGALGVGCALGEIDAGQIDEDDIPGRADLYATRAMVFSGTETDACEAIVLGNLPGVPPSILSGLTQDLLDIQGLARIAGHGDPEAGRESVRQGRLRASFFKAGSRADGRIRGGRTTIHASEMDPDKQLRGAASGVLGAFLGSTQFFMSGGAEHQAPPGQCLYAALVSS
jgi:cyanuric acid amidohydrolase